MQAITEISKNVYKYVFGGAKVPGGISNPVLRSEDGKYYIAYFGYTYGKQDLVEKRFKRPMKWVLLDIESGELVKVFDCAEKDFSKAPYDKVYSLNDPNVKQGTEEYFRIMDMLFDTARASIVYSKSFDKANYQAYLNNLYAITPQEYRVFYKELSV